MTPELPVKIADILPPLAIESLVNGGAGLAHHAGRVVFVPHTAVGDVVVCRVTKVKKTFLEAEICAIEKPSPLRQSPLCPVAGECGGCQWQHLPYDEQLNWKEKLFCDSLIRNCGIAISKIHPLLPAPHPWGYRSRTQIKCEKRGDKFVTGFFRSKSHDIVPAAACPLLPPELNDLLCLLRSLLSPSPYAGDITQIDLSIDCKKKTALVFHYCGTQLSAFADFLSATTLTADILIKTPEKRSLHAVTGSGILQVTVANPPIELEYAAGSFAQINLAQNRVLVARVIDFAALKGTETVLDLFCGMGNFSLPLATRAAHVIGIEASRSSIKMAKRNQVKNNLGNVRFYNRSAVGALGHFSHRQAIDLVILDPPRGGAVEVMNELALQPVKRIIYVSCDQQTLARDLKILLSCGYTLVASQALDLFPQTSHCESITLLQWGV